MLVLLFLATFAAYRPAWHGGFVWDDDGHVTRAELRSTDGLRRIWVELGATQQYYPVVHSTFWVMHRLWGDRTLGYHLVNITLHAFSAVLIVILLWRLEVPGAIVAGVAFALHPMNVESVAWISELKNTLSTVFYLSAALVYLRFDRDRRPPMYAIALVLFVLGLLSKTMIATLPATLLVVLWWKRGRLRWREDIQPLAPFIVLGIAAGLATAWIEHSVIGAQGSDFSLSVFGRVIIAGRAIWFYLAKIVWPATLIFTYPRWQIGPASFMQWLAPVAAVAMFVVLWRFRARSRAPFAAFAAYVIALLPVLGFLNVYPFKFSFVADHFAYLAMIPVLAFISAAATIAIRRVVKSDLVSQTALSAFVGGIFGLLTFQQSAQYVSAETLYRTTLARNPASWMAHDNLAVIDLNLPQPDLDDATEHLLTSLRLNPSNVNARNNLGVMYQKRKMFAEARREHELAIQIEPNNAEARNNLGADLQQLGDNEHAIVQYRLALARRPSYAQALANLGSALLATGRPDEAINQLRTALRLAPDDADAHDTLARALTQKGESGEAAVEYAEAIRLRPQSAEFRNNYGTLLEQLGRMPEAESQYVEALRLKPDAARIHDNLGFVLFRTNRAAEAVPHFQEAIRLDPSYASAHYNLGNVWLQANRFEPAIAEYRLTLKYEPGEGSAECHNNLGVALASLGRIAEARTEFQKALRIRPDFVDARNNLARLR